MTLVIHSYRAEYLQRANATLCWSGIFGIWFPTWSGLRRLFLPECFFMVPAAVINRQDLLWPKIGNRASLFEAAATQFAASGGEFVELRSFAR
jgi:hypothetical protein